ncbi:DEKNAAC105683 [Brettanomyces naardenensis]|uniref:DEKNAAC105683 n=1 Tax=Brettanomyces naardenensis TaxID=13370 RepID=A0A448YU00_BRENA|nr:DEKNAAC105683 [Brettanomyces naardenensis]
MAFRIHHRRRLIVIFLILLIFYLLRREFYERPAPVRRLGLQTSDNCPDYSVYSKRTHEPLSEGKLHLPFMRPDKQCRTFESSAVESVIMDLKLRIADPDLFWLFQNAFPNTLDTTIWWYKPSDEDTDTPRTFVATGDIAAEWLRDSARQLSVYMPFIRHDEQLRNLVKGAIVQQALYIHTGPYCNAFQPPEESGLQRVPSAVDTVGPTPNWSEVFECKWEIDSLASFLTLTNEYIQFSGDNSILTLRLWISAFKNILYVLSRQSTSTFDPHNGRLEAPYYIFQRETRLGTETLPLYGRGNPVNSGTGLVRSAFRPSDDSCIFQFFIPGNAQMATELEKLAPVLADVGLDAYSVRSEDLGSRIREGIMKHGVVESGKYGKVFAYEVDGFASFNMMDDANIPSLLSLPDLGFISSTDPTYQNTRKMVLSRDNPYYLKGSYFEGIGGPHIGLANAWPMSLLVQIRTSDDDIEIARLLELVKGSTCGLGLMHESVQVNSPSRRFTRSWFSWCNSEFAKTILDLAQRKPHLIFKDEYRDKPYEFKGL